MIHIKNNKSHLLEIINIEVGGAYKEVLQESFRGFNMKVFKRLESLKGMIEYAENRLPYLGGGMARIVFGYKAGKVIKIAVDDEYGVEQNMAEIEAINSHLEVQENLIKIFDYDHENYFWIIAEGVKIIKDNVSLAKKFNFPEDYLWNFEAEAGMHDNFEGVIKELKRDDEFAKFIPNKLEKKLLLAIISMVHSNITDVGSISQWGMTTDGRLVLADAGMTE